MATYTIHKPTKQTGRYVSLRIPDLPGDEQFYIDAGFEPDGAPRAYSLVAANIGITTDATVSNRIPYINIQHEQWFGVGGVKGAAIAASSAGSTDFMGVTHMDAAGSGGANTGLVGIHPEAFVIQGRARLDVFHIGGVPGDVAQYNFLFKYLGDLND